MRWITQQEEVDGNVITLSPVTYVWHIVTHVWLLSRVCGWLKQQRTPLHIRNEKRPAHFSLLYFAAMLDQRLSDACKVQQVTLVSNFGTLWHPHLIPRYTRFGTRQEKTKGITVYWSFILLWEKSLTVVNGRSSKLSRRRSPIPVGLSTGLNVEQLCSWDERRYCYTPNPPTKMLESLGV